MSFAGRDENTSGCVTKPKAREIGLSGFAAQIQPCSLTGSYVMATAEHQEPYESRGSRTVLGARGGEIPPRDSTTVRISPGKRSAPSRRIDPKPDLNSTLKCVGGNSREAQCMQDSITADREQPSHRTRPAARGNARLISGMRMMSISPTASAQR